MKAGRTAESVSGTRNVTVVMSISGSTHKQPVAIVGIANGERDSFGILDGTIISSAFGSVMLI